MNTLAIDPRRRPMGAAVLALLLGGAGAAAAGDPPSPVVERADATLFGLQALDLMQRERRDRREVPRMLPLLATPTVQGRLWVGLARHRREADGTADLRLEAVWVIPLGR